MLFVFNVFFPMYPMDGAKIITCSLQLFCGASPRTAAKVLIWTSLPLAAFFGFYSLAVGGGRGLMSGVSAYMGLMCFMETWKIYRLLQEDRLHTHPLFEQARSSTYGLDDGFGMSQRLNTFERDDPEVPSRNGQSFQSAQANAFSGAGRLLVAETSLLDVERQAALVPQEINTGKAAWLDRLEHAGALRGKTVRQLEEERSVRTPGTGTTPVSVDMELPGQTTSASSA
jgi:hypothetical protein